MHTFDSILQLHMWSVSVNLYIEAGVCVCVKTYVLKNTYRLRLCVWESIQIFKSVYRLRLLCVCVSLLEQREREEHEEGSEEREEGQDSPIPSGDDIHLYGNQTHQGGTGQWICVFVSEFRVGWQLDPELLISSGDAQVSRSAVATATVSGVLWLCRGTPPTTTKPTHGDRSPFVTQSHIRLLFLSSVSAGKCNQRWQLEKKIHFNLLICNPNNCYENPEKHNFKSARKNLHSFLNHNFYVSLWSFFLFSLLFLFFCIY